jgi:methylenetetrahydrofolate reductase (NADPH)
MKVTDHIQSGKKQVSFEILPPAKGSSIQMVFDTLDPLMQFQPAYVNITYHQSETVLMPRENGLLEARNVRKRPGTVAIAAAIHHRYQVDMVPHLICGGFSKDETEDALIDLNYLGIENILVIRGDGDPLSKKFQPVKDGHHYAIDLVKQIMNMNKGIYLDEMLHNATKSNFQVGVAGYPEKHAESPNKSTDLAMLKAKIDAGAAYIVTQMFFDNKKFFDFVNDCRAIGITVPIIPGLKPLATRRQLNVIPQTFKVDIPDELSREVEKCSSQQAVRQLGIEWTVQQSKELFAYGMPLIHYFTMGRVEGMVEIVKHVL